MSKKERDAIRARCELAKQWEDTHGVSIFVGGRALLDDATALLDALDQMEAWVTDLQSGMYVNCVYCGHRYGPEDSVPATMADALKEHVEQCPKHPMSALKTDRDRWRARAEAAEADRDRWKRRAQEGGWEL